jgi:hypothetical protein
MQSGSSVLAQAPSAFGMKKLKSAKRTGDRGDDSLKLHDGFVDDMIVVSQRVGTTIKHDPN